jgi:hypothetical protein
MSRELRAALSRAAELLQERGHIEQAITDAESALPQLIDQRLTAQSELATAEANAALDADKNVTGTNLKTARSKLTSAREALDSAVARVSGLKRRRDVQLQSLAEARSQLAELLPDYYREASSQFAEEWHTSVRLFSLTLTRRAALEALTGPLDLVEPGPTGEAVDLGELSEPVEVLRGLTAAVAQIESARAQEVRESRQPPAYDLDAIYQFIRDADLDGRHYRSGDRIVGSLLSAGAFKYCASVRLLKRLDVAHV